MSLLRTSLPPSRAQTLLKQTPRGSQNPLPVPVGNPWEGGRGTVGAERDAHGPHRLWLSPLRLPASGAASPRPPRAHTHAHTETHAHTDTLTPVRRPRPRPRPGPCGRPLRHSPTPHAARPGWREAAASGSFDFPAARAPRSRSPSRGGGARSRVPGPAAARAKSQRGAAQPRRSGLCAAGVRPPTPPAPDPAPHAPLPSPAALRSPPEAARPSPHTRLHDSARPYRCPLPAPLRISPRRPSSLGTLPLSAGPPASSSRHPHPLLYPRPPLPPPPFSLSLPTPPLRAPLSSLCRPAPAPELGESPGFQPLWRRRESRRD